MLLQPPTPTHVTTLVAFPQTPHHMLSLMLVPALAVSSAALLVLSCKSLAGSSADRSALTASSLSDASSGFQWPVPFFCFARESCLCLSKSVCVDDSLSPNREEVEMKKPRPKTTLLACAVRIAMMDLADIILFEGVCLYVACVCTSRVSPKG